MTTAKLTSDAKTLIRDARVGFSGGEEEYEDLVIEVAMALHLSDDVTERLLALDDNALDAASLAPVTVGGRVVDYRLV